MEKNNWNSSLEFWNDFEKYIECVKSIYRQKNLSYTLILVDNNSQNKFSNEIFKWLKNNNKEVIKVNKKKYEESKFGSSKKCFYIKNKFNYGCGLGHNPGYQFCIDNNFKYTARIDNDMVVPENTLKKLVDNLKKIIL